MEAVPSKAQILQSLKDFLKEKSLPPKAEECQHCGRVMKFFEAHLALRGTLLQWSVSLPFCPACDRGILKDLPVAETIH